MLKFIFSNMVRAKKTAALCILGISVSIMMLFSLVQIGETMTAYYDDMLLSCSDYDVSIREINPTATKDIQMHYQDIYDTTIVEYVGVFYGDRNSMT